MPIVTPLAFLALPAPAPVLSLPNPAVTAIRDSLLKQIIRLLQVEYTAWSDGFHQVRIGAQYRSHTVACTGGQVIIHSPGKKPGYEDQIFPIRLTFAELRALVERAKVLAGQAEIERMDHYLHHFLRLSQPVTFQESKQGWTLVYADGTTALTGTLEGSHGTWAYHVSRSQSEHAYFRVREQCMEHIRELVNDYIVHRQEAARLAVQARVDFLRDLRQYLKTFNVPLRVVGGHSDLLLRDGERWRVAIDCGMEITRLSEFVSRPDKAQGRSPSFERRYAFGALPRALRPEVQAIVEAHNEALNVIVLPAPATV